MFGAKAVAVISGELLEQPNSLAGRPAIRLAGFRPQQGWRFYPNVAATAGRDGRKLIFEVPGGDVRAPAVVLRLAAGWEMGVEVAAMDDDLARIHQLLNELVG